LELLETVVPGSKFTGLYSQVKVSSLVTLHNSLTVVPGSLAAATTDEEIDAYLAGDPASNQRLFDYLYPEYALQWREDQLAELFDWVPVDVESLKAYVVWLETQSQLIKGAKKDTAEAIFDHPRCCCCDPRLLPPTPKSQPLWAHVLRGHQRTKRQQGVA
jgi:hypothetical protein